jgi:hypothetical protein
MTPRAMITRRRLLAAAIGIGGIAAVARSRPWRVLVAVSVPSAAERLAGLLTNQDSAKAVGGAYLARVPEEASASLLVDRIAAGLPAGRQTVREAGEEDLRQLLATQIRSDFEEEQDVVVRGWVLSRTEARLYALTTLV